MEHKQHTLNRSKGSLVVAGSSTPYASRRNRFQTYCGYSYREARRKAQAKVAEQYPGHPISSFALSKNCHAWLVQAPCTGDPIELFVLQAS